MGKRLQQLSSLTDEAKLYVAKVLLVRGTNYELINPQDLEDEFTDEFYDLPGTLVYSKHGHYTEHKIVVINLVDGHLEFETVDTEDYYDHKLDGSEFESVTWLWLADFIESLEKENV